MTLTLCKTLAGLLVLAVAGCGGSQQAQTRAESAGPTQKTKVGVYYMHRAMRCPMCVKIEKKSRQVVRERFAEELAEGTLRWDSINYQQQESLEKRYRLYTSSLVLVSYKDGREVSHEILDKTWVLHPAPKEFEAYVVEAIRNRLGRS